MKKTKATAARWETFTQLALTAHRAGRTLGVLVQVDALTVMAVESASSTENTAEAVEASLASHGHRFVGGFASLQEAMTAAETFVGQWAAGLAIEKCSCLARSA